MLCGIKQKKFHTSTELNTTIIVLIKFNSFSEVPMNKVQVGAAPSPNLKSVRSKIGSLDNTTYKPSGGKVKIENRKLDFSKVQPKIAAKNDKYTPSGGDKKVKYL